MQGMLRFLRTVIGVSAVLFLIWKAAFELVGWAATVDFVVQQATHRGWLAEAIVAILRNPPPFGVVGILVALVLLAIAAIRIRRPFAQTNPLHNVSNNGEFKRKAEILSRLVRKGRTLEAVPGNTHETAERIADYFLWETECEEALRKNFSAADFDAFAALPAAPANFEGSWQNQAQTLRRLVDHRVGYLIEVTKRLLAEKTR